MYKMFLFLCFFCSCFLSNGFSEEDFIDLRTFIRERTQQYPLPKQQKIFLCTPPRTGSTLVYSVLKFLFENENHFGWENISCNLVIKSHDTKIKGIVATRIFTMRNPVDACVSHYRVSCSMQKRMLPFSCLSDLIKEQVRFILYLDELISRNEEVIVLKYEDFNANLDCLFAVLEDKLRISINLKDKVFLKKALSKENVNKNTAHLSTFSAYDNFHLFHGAHINQNELSKELEFQIRRELISQLESYSSLFEKWGYCINPNAS